jgi:Tfp pilus assembly protein PilF
MGLYFWNKRSKEGLEKAIDYFGRAVQQDPNFALAYALMTDCYYLQVYYGYNTASDTIGNAKAAADRALLLDDSVAEAHVARAMVHCLKHEPRPSMESLRRALELNPNSAVAHLRYAWSLCAFGQLNDAVRQMKRAQELDPLSATNSTALGILLTFARQFDGALAYCARAAELEPSNFLVRCNLAISYGLNGMFQQAIDQYRMAGELSLDNKGDVLASIATMLTSAGRKSEADPMMPEILELAIAGKADPYNVAVLCAARGDKEEGFKWLAKAAANRQLMSGILRYDPQLDPLRSDDRFTALLRQHDRASLLENP